MQREVRPGFSPSNQDCIASCNISSCPQPPILRAPSLWFLWLHSSLKGKPTVSKASALLFNHRKQITLLPRNNSLLANLECKVHIWLPRLDGALFADAKLDPHVRPARPVHHRMMMMMIQHQAWPAGLRRRKKAGRNAPQSRRQFAVKKHGESMCISIGDRQTPVSNARSPAEVWFHGSINGPYCLSKTR